MRRLLFSIVFLCFIMGCQFRDVRYVHYHNERFGFELDYPSFMTKEPPPENGDGIRCYGHEMEIVAAGGLDIDTIRHPERHGIYHTNSVNNPDGTVTIEKTAYFLGTDNGDINITLHITYPQEHVDEAVIQHIVESFYLNKG